MANNAVLRNNAPIQSVGHFLPPVGAITWDGSRRLQLGRISRLIGSNITLNTTNNTILLQPGTYKLTACWQIGFATGQATIKWYNETTASFFGQELFIPTVDNNSNWNTSNILIETITVTSATSVSIRDTGSGTTQPTETRSYVIVEQLDTIIQINEDTNPTGTIIQSVAPILNNYLLCDGASYARASYQNLFNLLNILKGIATLSIATPCVITLANHGLTTGQTVFFTTTGALPTGVNANTTYFINVINANTFNLATSYVNLIAGTYIATSGSQSGTHSLYLTIGGVTSATTFNVPDLQGRVLASINSSHGIGKIIGTETQTLVTANLPPHSHQIFGDSGSGIGSSGNSDRVLINGDGDVRNVFVKNTETTGSGTAFNNMQPTFFIYTHIKF
jgi:microcystin-dependent protein